MKKIFNSLYEINVNEHVEKKNKLTYLSWAYAWAEVKKLYPDATYKIWKDECNRPYIYDDILGYMCFTSVTINGETLEMWLPVMDGANKAMKCEEYTYKVKDWYVSKAQNKEIYKDKTVEAATMFDINKTIMRCLVKNLAMFGLGLYIYAGEDLPEVTEEKKKQAPKEQKKQSIDNDRFKNALDSIKAGNYSIEKLIETFDLTVEQKKQIEKI